MIRKDKRYFKNGSYKTQVRVTEGYRDKNGKPKQRTVKSFGYLEDQENQEEFLAKVKEFNDNFKNEKRIVFNSTSTTSFYDDKASTTYNFGYKFLESIYDEFDLNQIFNNYDYHGKTSLNEILKFLVIQRILNPDSKRATYQQISNLYGKNYNFSLHTLYRSLTKFSALSNDIQKAINDYVKNNIGRDTTNVFYDSTNYYFEVDYEDEDKDYVEISPIITNKKIIEKEKLFIVQDDDGIEHQYKPIPGIKKRGVSKDHKTDPIVQLGLLMDNNGIPINYQIFPGNTADSLTLHPVLDEIKQKYELSRVIVVADKGMNCADNIIQILNNGDGYMFSQVLRGKKGARYKDRIFNESLYTVVNADYKYQLFDEEYEAKGTDGTILKHKRRVLLYWNGVAARREKHKRDEKLKKAEKAKKNKAYLLSHGYDKYIKETNYIENSGEVADKSDIEVDYDKANEEALYDGYFAIVTTELQFSEAKIREVYHGLWRIEESFKVTKSDLVARPIFVWTEEHIKGHFLTCFVALAILRILQKKMNYSLSVERLVRAINMCSCSELSNGVMHLTKENVFRKYEKIIDKNGNEVYTLRLENTASETVEDFKELLKYFKISSKHTCTSVINKGTFDKYLNSIKFEAKL